MFPSHFQHFSTCFNYYSEIVGQPKVCQNFFITYQIRLYDRLYPRFMKEKCPKSAFFVISHQGDHYKIFPTKSSWTIKWLLYWKKKFKNMVAFFRRITLSKTSNSSFLDFLHFHLASFVDAVLPSLKTTNFNHSEM